VGLPNLLSSRIHHHLNFNSWLQEILYVHHLSKAPGKYLLLDLLNSMPNLNSFFIVTTTLCTNFISWLSFPCFLSEATHKLMNQRISLLQACLWQLHLSQKSSYLLYRSCTLHCFSSFSNSNGLCCSIWWSIRC